jgi:hypothetical protein
MPPLQQVLLVLAGQFSDSTQFGSAESASLLKRNRVKPEFCYFVLSLHMNVRRLTVIT